MSCRRKEKTQAEAAALLIASNTIQAFWGEGRGRLRSSDDRRKALEIHEEGMANGAWVSELPLLLGVGLSMLQ